MLALALFAACHAAAAVAAVPLALNNFVGDHMVLARAPDAANVWGNATAGSKITVSLDKKQVASATATADGRWIAALPPQSAGAGHTLTVTDGSATLQIVDVAFGDVRVRPCSSLSAAASLPQPRRCLIDSVRRHLSLSLETLWLLADAALRWPGRSSCAQVSRTWSSA